MRPFVVLIAALLGSVSMAAAQAPKAVPPVIKAPASVPLAGPKAYLRPELESDAVRTKAAVKKAMADEAKDKTADQLFADGQRQATSDPNAAVDAFGGAIAAGRDDMAVWLGLAKAIDAAVPTIKDDDDRKSLLNGWQPSAAYIAYKRASTRHEEALALNELGSVYATMESWRSALDTYKASLKAEDSKAIRAIYDPMREEHGFQIKDYKVDSDSPSARACFQFTESLAKGRTDFASFVAVGGTANAAVSVDDQQLCVEGLNHGQRYSITIRQGLPSAVEETLLKSADYDIFVRDRSPQVHFVGKTYVLPRVGPEGIPVVSTNTTKVDVRILRIGDRSLVPTVRSEDFMNQLYSYKLNQIADTDGALVWSGSLDVEQTLNEDVTTAFPVLEAVGKMQPGIYVMQAGPHKDGDQEAGGPKPTQWFVVSDLGLTALSGQAGVTALVRSLATAEPVKGVELKLLAKNNEVLATQSTDAAGSVKFDAGLSRGEGGNAPAMLVATGAAGDYNFLDLGQAPFDLTDRGVKGRPSPKGLDVFVYTERGVYRSGETVYLTALLRDAAGQSAAGLPLTLVVKRPDGVEYKRVAVPDGGLGGHALPLPLLPGASTGTWRVEAFADPKGESIGEASFLVDDYVPEKLAFDLAPQQKLLEPGEAAQIATTTPASSMGPLAGTSRSTARRSSKPPRNPPGRLSTGIRAA